MELEGKKTLVTGASRGIGRAIALTYAKEGADVAITSRKAASLESLAAEIAELGRRAVPMEWDVCDVASADARVEEAAAKLGGLDVVVNNAGVISPTRFPDVPEDEWDAVMNTNLKALYFICQSVCKRMKEAGAGIVINIGSIAGIDSAPHPYGISKWGVRGLTKGLAKQVGPWGIRMNAIAPGPIYTEMMGWHPGDPIEKEGTPLGRWNYPEEVADAAVFLASKRAVGIAGEILVVDGAIHL